MAIAAFLAATLFGGGGGCGGGDDRSERAVNWAVDPPVGPNWVRIDAPIKACIHDQSLVEAPIIEYEGNRVYIELRHTPEDDKGICFLNLPIASKKITFERDLDELILFDASTDPPERRWHESSCQESKSSPRHGAASTEARRYSGSSKSH